MVVARLGHMVGSRARIMFRFVFGIFSFLVVALLTGVAVRPQAALAQTPFLCDGAIYQVIRFPDAVGNYTDEAGLYSLDIVGGQYEYSLLSNASFVGFVNSMAFNVGDGFIYATSMVDPASPSPFGVKDMF